MKLLTDVKEFFRCKFYTAVLALTAVCAYGFTVTHPSVGMDDTAVSLYFEEGLAPYVGRWSLFVLNKVFRIGTFAPWMVELASVLLLMVSVTMWCVVWKRACGFGAKLPTWAYGIVACIFISCPLISEVFVFYLHNGICLGYGFTAGALLCLMEALERENTGHRRLGRFFLSCVLLTVALGFYESFIIVYMMGAVTVFFLLRRLHGGSGGEADYKTGILPWMGGGFLSVLGSLVLRVMALGIVKMWCGPDRFGGLNVLYRNAFGSIFSSWGEFSMLLKHFFMKYYVHAVCYLPITVLAAAVLFIGAYSLWCGIRRRDPVLPLCAAVLALLPVCMALVEGLATRYRSAQYVPLMGAFGALLVLVEFWRHPARKWVRALGFGLAGILIYNQCADMNRWFYADYLKYQDAREVMARAAYDLEKGYDTSKPVVFRGAYRVPYEISKDAYLDFSSAEYGWICALTDWFDPYLKEKYFSYDGKFYVFAEMPTVSTLQWGVTAFNGTSWQLIEFWRMHGYDSFRCETDLDKIAEAERIRWDEDMPAYPRDGYIRDCGEYIIVNLGR